MDSFELNKIFGALTAALLAYLTIDLATDAIFAPAHHGHSEQALAFAIPIEEGAEAAPVEEVETISLAALIADADVDSGEKVFNKCKSCHSIEAGGRNGVGPALHGVMGRTIAGHDGFSYSAALTDAGGAWDWESMNAFLEDPKGWAPGTRMNFAGLRKESDRADLMAYLNANSDAPIEVPVE